ncbi:hypothetical protein ACHQM5_027478 [Ranunculus cassubicifolius]
MANKVVALFVVCMVLAATISVQAAYPDPDEARFVQCFNNCLSECKSTGGGHTDCEIKCDEECSDKELEELPNMPLDTLQNQHDVQ